MKTCEWTPKRRSRALGLIKGGRHSLSEISQITNIPKGTLGDLKKRDTPLNKVRSGRPYKLSERAKRAIERLIKQSYKTRRLSAKSIIRDLQLEVCESTVKLALKNLGYRHCIARRRTYLTKKDRKRRLQFAKRHRHLTIEDWKSYVFTDEMGVKMGIERASQDWVWRKPGEEFHPDCINYQKRPGGKGLMFWGAFRWGKMGPGVFFDLGEGESINSMVYRDQILLGPLKEFWEESFGNLENPIVVEDNAPVHKKVCIPVRQELEMTCHQHPPNSPDLNPIEHIWAYIKDILRREYSHITSKEELKRIILKIWNEFEDSQWNYLIESMVERIEAVIAAKGGSTRF